MVGVEVLEDAVVERFGAREIPIYDGQRFFRSLASRFQGTTAGQWVALAQQVGLWPVDGTLALLETPQQRLRTTAAPKPDPPPERVRIARGAYMKHTHTWPPVPEEIGAVPHPERAGDRVRGMGPYQGCTGTVDELTQAEGMPAAWVKWDSATWSDGSPLGSCFPLEWLEKIDA